MSQSGQIHFKNLAAFAAINLLMPCRHVAVKKMHVCRKSFATEKFSANTCYYEQNQKLGLMILSLRYSYQFLTRLNEISEIALIRY